MCVQMEYNDYGNGVGGDNQKDSLFTVCSFISDGGVYSSKSNKISGKQLFRINCNKKICM